MRQLCGGVLNQGLCGRHRYYKIVASVLLHVIVPDVERPPCSCGGQCGELFYKSGVPAIQGEAETTRAEGTTISFHKYTAVLLAVLGLYCYYTFRPSASLALHKSCVASF